MTIPRRWGAAAIGLGLALTGCGSDAAEVTGGDDGGSAPTADAEAADPGDASDPAADGSTTDVGAEGGPANGVLVVDDEELPLETAHRCPPRDMIGADGQITGNTFVFGTDGAYGLNVWEQTVDGVLAHRVGGDAPGLSLSAEQIVEEGAPGFPLLEVDGDRIRVQAVLPGTGGVEVPIEAEWDVPTELHTAGAC